MSTWSHGLLNLLICVGLLVVMPLGLRLLAVPGLTGVHRLWFLAATPAAASVWLPRGWLAAGVAAAYLPATAALLLAAGRVLLARRLPWPRAVAAATTLAAPTVAACALVAERAGHPLFGFDLDVLALTVAHFQYAGFAGALIAGLVCEVDGDGPAGRLAVLSVPAGVAVVFAGFFTSEWVELAGATLLAAGMWLVGWLTWRRAATAGRVRRHHRAEGATTRHNPAGATGAQLAQPPHRADSAATRHDPAAAGGPIARRARPAQRVLLLVSAATLAATMVLALDWALGQAAGLPHLPISWMVATHGLANALGFAICGLVAWQRIGRSSEWH